MNFYHWNLLFKSVTWQKQRKQTFICILQHDCYSNLSIRMWSMIWTLNFKQEIGLCFINQKKVWDNNFSKNAVTKNRGNNNLSLGHKTKAKICQWNSNATTVIHRQTNRNLYEVAFELKFSRDIFQLKVSQFINYCTRAIISRSQFEAALNYKPRIWV